MSISLVSLRNNRYSLLMKLIKNALFASVACCALSTTYAQNADEQSTYQVKIDVEDPDFDDLDSPDGENDTRDKTWTQKEWLEMEVKMEVKAIKPERKDKTLPKLTVKWFIVAEDPTKSKKNYIVLKKEVEHINIPVGEEVYLSCYISPSGVRRLSNGGDKARKNVIFGVGGEIYVEGNDEPVAFFTSKKTKVKVGGRTLPFWYSPDLAESTSVQIRDKNETPFKWMWWDRYAEIAPDKKK